MSIDLLNKTPWAYAQDNAMDCLHCPLSECVDIPGSPLDARCPIDGHQGEWVYGYMQARRDIEALKAIEPIIEKAKSLRALADLTGVDYNRVKRLADEGRILTLQAVKRGRRTPVAVVREQF